MIKKIFFILAIVFTVCLVRDFCLKSLISTVATNITGASTSIGGLSLSIIGQSIKISDLRMRDPQGFPNEVFVNIPKANVSWDLFAFFTGKIHLKSVELDIKEVVMIKNKDGQTNIQSLKMMQKKSDPRELLKTLQQIHIQIDFLTLGIGRAVSKDYKAAAEPVIKVYNLNTRRSYRNINSLEQLAALIISEPLKSAGLQSLTTYAVSMLTGVAALPVAAAFMFAAKDYDQVTENISMNRAYEIGLNLLKRIGKVKSENKGEGVINAEVYSAHVVFKLREDFHHKIEITISARRIGFPQPEVASGVMYQFLEQLK